MKKKIIVKFGIENKIYVLISILVWLSVIQFSLIKYTDNSFIIALKIIGYVVRCLLLIVTIPLYQNILHSREKTVLLWCLLLTSLMMFYKMQTCIFFDLFYISIICANRLTYKKVVNVFFYSTFVGIVITFCLYCLDFFPELQIYREHVQRYNFGFNHPNILGRAMMLLTFLWFIKRENKLNYGDILLGFVIAIWIYLYPNSVSSAGSLLLITLILYIDLLWKRVFYNKTFLFRRIGYWVILLVLVGIGVIYYLVLCKNDVHFWGDFSDTFYTRFSYAYLAIKKYGWTLFGNPDVEIISSTDLFFKQKIGRYFPMDLFYVYLPMVYGVIPALFFVYMYIKALLNTVRIKKNVLLVVLMVMLVYSIMESAINTFCFSFIFILPFCNTYEK